MTDDELNKLSYILKNDRTQSIYKYFILLATIDICKNNSDLSELIKDPNEFSRVSFPIGLVIWKWLKYFYYFFSAGKNIVIQNREKSGSLQSAIRRSFEDLVASYGPSNYDTFNRDLLSCSIPKEYVGIVISTVNELYDVIKSQAMKHFGNSIYYNRYSVFKVALTSNKILRKNLKLDLGYIIDNYSSFSITESLYSTLKETPLYEIYKKTQLLDRCIFYLKKVNDSIEVSPTIFSELIPTLPGENEAVHYEFINNIFFQLERSDLENNTNYSIENIDAIDEDNCIDNINIADLDITTLHGIKTLLSLLIQDLKYLGYENQKANVVGPLMVFQYLPSSRIGYFACESAKDINKQLTDLCDAGIISSSRRYTETIKRSFVYYSLSEQNINIYNFLYSLNEKIIQNLLNIVKCLDNLLTSQNQNNDDSNNANDEMIDKMCEETSFLLYKLGIEKNVAQLLAYMQYYESVSTHVASQLLGNLENFKTGPILRDLAISGWITESNKLNGMNKTYVLRKPILDIAIEYALDTSSKINNALNELKIIIDKIESVHPKVTDYTF